MPYGTDGQPYPLIRPKRYPIRSQSDWPEPEEPMDARTFAMLRDYEQDLVKKGLTSAGKDRLIDDLALELQGRLVAEQEALTLTPDQCCECDQPSVGYSEGSPYCAAHYRSRPSIADPTETLEAMTADDVAMSEAARESTL